MVSNQIIAELLYCYQIKHVKYSQAAWKQKNEFLKIRSRCHGDGRESNHILKTFC